MRPTTQAGFLYLPFLGTAALKVKVSAFHLPPLVPYRRHSLHNSIQHEKEQAHEVELQEWNSPKIAVIGAGPCGMSQLHAFQTYFLNQSSISKTTSQSLPTIVCFEQKSEWGGLWNFVGDNNDTNDENYRSSSMYRHLWSNGPKECSEYADYTFDKHYAKPIPSFLPREVMLDYISGRADMSGIRQYIKFNTTVRSVRFEVKNNSGQFIIQTENLCCGTVRTDTYDYVVCATGHFSYPEIPTFEGIKTFPGRVVHSRNFHDARQYANHDVLVVGASDSAEDICLQLYKFGAKSITATYRTCAMGFNWPSLIDERPLLTRIDGKIVSFSDGSRKEFDSIVLCTGYRHAFPFLEESLQLQSEGSLYPAGLFKGIIWMKNPKLFYLGMQHQYYTFNMFDLQAWYTRDVILGRIGLPSIDAMTEEIEYWLGRNDSLETYTDMIKFQADYMRNLIGEASLDYPNFDIDLTERQLIEWEQVKEQDIVGYRDTCYKSPITGTVASKPRISWIKAMDDTKKTFLETP